MHEADDGMEDVLVSLAGSVLVLWGAAHSSL